MHVVKNVNIYITIFMLLVKLSLLRLSMINPLYKIHFDAFCKFVFLKKLMQF